ncbi:hypothetical protein CN918_25755 [Priestia megaterium]|nr:hypothetical protein CN918_25755 [Priestia megaterium]
MKKEILCIASSAFFSVFTKHSLSPFASCRVMNLRYPNEEFSQVQHDFQAIDDMYMDYYQQAGLAPRVIPYVFTSQVASRLESYLNELAPDMVFVEMQSLDEAEFKVLNHLHDLYDGPIAVVVSHDEKTSNKIYRLLMSGVKEILIEYDKQVFIDAMHRHLPSHE